MLSGKEQGEELFRRSDSLGQKLRRRKESLIDGKTLKNQNTKKVVEIKEDDGPHLLLMQRPKEGQTRRQPVALLSLLGMLTEAAFLNSVHTCKQGSSSTCLLVFLTEMLQVSTTNIMGKYCFYHVLQARN